MKRLRSVCTLAQPMFVFLWPVLYIVIVHRLRPTKITKEGIGENIGFGMVTMEAR